MMKTTLLRQRSFLTVNRTSGLLIWWYSFYLYDIRLFKWMLYEHLSLSNLSVSVICLWLLFTSFFAYHYVRSKWKRDNRLNIDTILRADIVSTLKFLIKGRGKLQFWQIYHPFQFITISLPSLQICGFLWKDHHQLYCGLSRFTEVITRN